MRIVLDANIFVSATISPSGVCSQIIQKITQQPDLFEAAITANAQIIVTGDQDLLVLKELEGISIMTPRDFYHLNPLFHRMDVF